MLTAYSKEAKRMEGLEGVEEPSTDDVSSDKRQGSECPIVELNKSVYISVGFPSGIRCDKQIHETFRVFSCVILCNSQGVSKFIG